MFLRFNFGDKSSFSHLRYSTSIVLWMSLVCSSFLFRHYPAHKDNYLTSRVNIAIILIDRERERERERDAWVITSGLFLIGVKGDL